MKRENRIMDWKEFLKPDWKKIVITVILTILTNWILFPSFFWIEFDINPYINCLGENCYVKPAKIPNILILILFVFYYLLSCFIVWVYNKHLKKTKKI